MKHTVRMLTTLPGCDAGVIYPTTYREGEVYEIGRELLDCFVALGGVELAPADPVPAETRDTKVTGPAETKPRDLTAMSVKQLAAYAKDALGLDLGPKASKAALLAAIERG